MSEPVLFLLCLIVPLIIILLVLNIYRQYDRNRLRDLEWRELAQRIGLTFSELMSGDRMVDGYYREYEVGIYFTEETAPDEITLILAMFLPIRSTNIVVVLEHPLVDTELSLSPETRIGKVGKLIIGEDVLVGDDTFDSSFRIRSRPAELAKRAFSRHDIRRRILEFSHPSFSFDGKELKWMSAGVEKDIDRIQRIVDLLCDIASEIGKNGPSHGL